LGVEVGIFAAGAETFGAEVEPFDTAFGLIGALGAEVEPLGTVFGVAGLIAALGAVAKPVGALVVTGLL